MREQQAKQLHKKERERESGGGTIIRSAADRLEDKLFAGLRTHNRSIPLSFALRLNQAAAQAAAPLTKSPLKRTPTPPPPEPKSQQIRQHRWKSLSLVPLSGHFRLKASSASPKTLFQLGFCLDIFFAYIYTDTVCT